MVGDCRGQDRGILGIFKIRRQTTKFYGPWCTGQEYWGRTPRRLHSFWRCGNRSFLDSTPVKPELWTKLAAQLINKHGQSIGGKNLFRLYSVYMVLERDFNIKAIPGWDYDDLGKLNWSHLALMAEIYVAILGVAKPLQAQNSIKLREWLSVNLLMSIL